MIRRHTTGPIAPVRPIAAVRPVALHRRSVPAQVMLQRAVQFYRSRLRALRTRPQQDGADSKP